MPERNVGTETDSSIDSAGVGAKPVNRRQTHRHSRHRLSGALIACALVLMLAAPLLAIDPAHLNTVTFHNDTGYDIHYLFFSPGDSTSWGVDILGSEGIFPAGSSLGYYIHYPDQSNEFDLLAVDADGDAYRRPGVRITDGTPLSISITMDDYKGSYYLPQLVELDLANDTGYEIQYLFISPGDSRMWGIDLLGDNRILASGGNVRAMVQLATVPLRVDVHGVDAERDSYQFSMLLDEGDALIEREITLSDLR